MEFKVGDKVVPHSKTFFLFDETVNNSIVWKRACNKKQPFLYVTEVFKKSTGDIYLMLDDHSDSVTGDYFMPHDVTLYEGDRITKMKDIKKDIRVIENNILVPKCMRAIETLKENAVMELEEDQV